MRDWCLVGVIGFLYFLFDFAFVKSCCTVDSVQVQFCLAQRNKNNNNNKKPLFFVVDFIAFSAPDVVLFCCVFFRE